MMMQSDIVPNYEKYSDSCSKQAVSLAKENLLLLVLQERPPTKIFLNLISVDVDTLCS